eukprot:COSAG01_NODE_6382_length_3703_cov_2.503607_5_plen_39_part_00
MKLDLLFAPRILQNIIVLSINYNDQIDLCVCFPMHLQL